MWVELVHRETFHWLFLDQLVLETQSLDPAKPLAPPAG